MKTISFIGNSEPPEKLLKLFKRQTPGNLGIWGQLQGVPTYDSDYYGVIDYLPKNLKHLESRCVFLGAHPPESHYAYSDMSKINCIAKADTRETVGFLEWWIKYDYDYLKNLKPMKKDKDLAAIVSDANSQIYHKKRRNHLERFCNKYSEELDLYGRIKPWGSLKLSYQGVCGSEQASAENNNDHMSGKEIVYESHKYMIEYDAPGEFYVSERILDCLLLWSYPIYWGGKNVHNLIPEKSFSYFDIDGDGEDIIDIVDSNIYEKVLPYIAKARNLLLDKWQLWPRTHQLIFGKTS